MVRSSKSLACWVTVGTGSGVWGVCDCEGRGGVGCVGRVIMLDCEGQGERHEEVQERALCSPFGDPAAWLQEGAEACSSADRVVAGADVARGEVVEGEAQAFPHRLQEEARGCSGRLS